MRMGLRTKAVLAFGAVFAVLAMIATAVNYFVLRDSIDHQFDGPTTEELQAAIDDIAAERGEPRPEVRVQDLESGFTLGAVELAGSPGSSVVLDDGRTVLTASEDWLNERVDPELVSTLHDDIERPTTEVEFDELVFIGPLQSLESTRQGITAEFLAFLTTLRAEDGNVVFAEPPVGDGDICVAAIVECSAVIQATASFAELEVDQSTFEILEEATLRAFSQARDDTLSAQLRISTLVAIASTAVAVAASWLVAQRILRPVREVTAVAQAASVDSLDRRIALEGPHDEVRELADTFDAMLERLERAFDAQRRFGSNAAHELKTPLAVMRAEIDAARADSRTSVRETVLLDRLDGAASHSERLVQALLDLARAETITPRSEAIELTEVVSDALIARQSQFNDRHLKIDFDIADERYPTEISGDLSLVTVLVENLLDNAAKYATESSEVSIRVGSSANHVWLRVTNDGAELTADQLDGLSEPFRRGQERTGTEGHGLGLSIVAAVARAHDAAVLLEPGLAGGLMALIRFPAPIQRSDITSPAWPK